PRRIRVAGAGDPAAQEACRGDRGEMHRRPRRWRPLRQRRGTDAALVDLSRQAVPERGGNQLFDLPLHLLGQPLLPPPHLLLLAPDLLLLPPDHFLRPPELLHRLLELPRFLAIAPPPLVRSAPQRDPGLGARQLGLPHAQLRLLLPELRLALAEPA